jgi:uncharacterized radical SAM superfamily Fe-S cluster-containing enzyme
MENEARKIASYIYHGETRSLCETCLSPVPAKIIVEGENVYFQKRCAAHGVQKTLVSTDAEFWLSAKSWGKPGDRPFTYQSKIDYGCPYDCGLCPDHEQHSCLALIEINEQCNLSCPVCFAGSSPAANGTKSLADIEVMLGTLIESEHQPDVLQISGGEPTLHPHIIDILKLCKSKPIRHLMLNTNGVRLASDRAFVQELKQFTPGFEIYLQFDSLNAAALENLRGANLLKVREKALANLEEAGISTTLVVTVKKGVNDHEIGAIIDHALGYRCVRGVTFQPIQDAGRNENFDPERDRVLLSDIRRAIGQQSAHFVAEDIIPLPCHPEHIAVGYALRNGNSLAPLTRMLPKEFWIKNAPNSVAFEKYPELRKSLFNLFSLSSTECNEAERVGDLLCCLPKVPMPKDLDYRNIFRIAISEFMDKYNFDLGAVKRSCIHFVTQQGKIIPFDTYNLFYRDGKIDGIRKTLDAARTRCL